MKSQSNSSPTSPAPGFSGQNVPRKPSFLKPPPPKQKYYALELPRFYSSDDKKLKKKIFSQEKEQTKQSPITKKQSSKYSKTEKKETPPKYQSSLKTIKLAQKNSKQIWYTPEDCRLQLGQPDVKRQQLVNSTEPLHIQSGVEYKLNANSSSNLNKIRYKLNPKLHKPESYQKRNEKNNEIERKQHNNQYQRREKTTRPEKSSTEAAYSPQHQIHTLANYQQTSQKFLEMQEEWSHKKKARGHAKSSVEISHEEIKFLQLMVDIIRQSLRNPRNLDFPEAYIVSQKAKHQKVIVLKLQQKYQKHYKIHIVLSRLTFYLTAHFILSGNTSKLIPEALKHLLQNQLIIMGVMNRIRQMVGVGQRRESVSKSTIPERMRRQKDADLAIQNRGGNIIRNNQKVRDILEEIGKIQHTELFQSLIVSSSKIDSFEFISFLDKTLKWEVLKMPSYPFLPPCITSHTHFLILDLDQTLIHYDSEKDIFHIRPHAEQFLKNLSQFYQISIFTAGTKEYADEIINQIDRGGYVKHRLYRNHLTFLGGQSVKDLTMLGRSMKSTLIIDNLQSNFRMHAQNGILIKSWFHDDSDQVLKKLQNLLTKIAQEYGDDLRKGVKAYQGYIDREITGRVDKAIKVKYKI